MTKPYDYDDDTDDGNDHKNDSHTAAGAAPGASVPCSLFLFLAPGSLFFVQIIPASGFRSGFRLLAFGFRLPIPASGSGTTRHDTK